MSKKFLAVLLSATMCAALAACGGGNSGNDSSTGDTAAAGAEDAGSEDAGSADAGEEAGAEASGYTYGADTTFYSEEPVTYSFMFNDNEGYPYTSDWKIFDAIQDMTNVDLKSDMLLVARSDYDDRVSVEVNSGSAPYIIPKIYDESPYVASGQIVPISDYVQYMPNFMQRVEEWDLADDLVEKYKGDGKYYVLPGMWESASEGYSFIIRKDIFDAAGVDVEGIELDWTYEDFYEACLKVKEHTGADYVISDRWEGESMLKISGITYGVEVGWAIDDGMKFDWDKMEFYYADTTDNFKEFVAFWNKMVADGIVDPETFTQDDDTAVNKFYRGETFVLSAEYKGMEQIITEDSMLIDDYELYTVVQPGGPVGQVQIESTRLENGVMISQNALNDLGEEDFIKMLRFVDWLWYSEEGQILTKWGVEGETYDLVDGKIVLKDNIAYDGLNPDAEESLQKDYGFGGGVFVYGSSDYLRTSSFTDARAEFYEKVMSNREARTLEPPIMADDMETEELTRVKTPLVDHVKTSYLKFILGQDDIEEGWESYTAQCEALGSQTYVNLANEIFERSRDVLGY